ncbi:MAG TPA: hypothetical protein ENK05_11395 [Gammaproteobacteria bacterium]|nr:hypothetical protein [Gammaproteobacteria bacterium]
MNFLDGTQRVRMHVQPPVAGYWYSNVVGRLQQVRMILHEDGRQRRVMLENINGKRRIVDLDDWYGLDLALHSPGIDRRRRRGS